MDHFQNDDLEYVVDDYFDVDDFDDDPFADMQSHKRDDIDPFDSDFEDDFDMSKPKTDTSALEARNGKDIQGIPWERLNFTRDKYRETRLKQYKNYESLSRSREDLEKECLEVEKGNTFYDFQFNTRLVKSTIVHFQKEIAQLTCECEQHIGTQSGGMDQAISVMAKNGFAELIDFNPIHATDVQLPAQLVVHLSLPILWQNLRK